ncbi:MULTISPECIES: hypothetical protein [Sphingobacterium]|nr:MULTISPECIES: hypothetical protein [Sphingobacterium]QQT45520.1 hypothetical protein I6J00_02180 [Sphingobacterium multivorum]SUJ26545.1 Uncharacterised protein [Sphingobacterium multivorum]VXD04689.1 conserved hypothetical protein [Sphingobacterium multivorum]
MAKLINVWISVFMLLVFVQCLGIQNEPSENFDWLLGKWQRTNEAKDKRTFEYWQKIKDTEYAGFAFTLQNLDTIHQEKMQLLKYDGDWNLLVKTPDEKDFIAFEITMLKDGLFECNNDSLPFPKKITYWREGEKLKANVAGDSLQIPFEFSRISK